MGALINCEYDFDKQTLFVYNPIDSNAVGGTSLSFEVDNFLNPYSGIPRSGYTIITTDSVGGQIDSSVVAGLTLSIQVLDWTSFSSLSLFRVDTQTIVGELSVG